MVKWLKKPWPYWVGGILLGIFNVILLAVTGTSWHITSGFMMWSAGVLEWIGFQPFSWGFFEHFSYKYGSLIASSSIFINKYSVLNVGIIVGSLIAVMLSSQFKIKKVKNKKQVIFALAGGIMMGYGSRLTSGCNVGSFFSGIPSFSLHAWVYWIFVVLGAIVGTKVLAKYVI